MNRRPRILAVDDDPMNRIVVMEYLEEDYDLIVVASGQECLDTLPTFRPDIVLLDIMMPGIDGYEVCRQIKADPRSRHVKVILVSAKAMLEERLEGYEAGADDYVTKPFSGDELRAKLDVYLKLRSVEEVDDLKSQFLGLLSHETRTPLTAILSPARLLEFELEDNPDQQEMAKLIIAGAQRMESMIDRALRLCEYKAGQTALSPTKLDFGELVDDVLSQHADAIEAKSMEVHRDASAGLEIEADDRELRFVVSGLIERLINDAEPEARLEIGWRIEDGKIELQIRDSGTSIEDSWLPHLFEDFYVPSLENHTGVLELDLALAGAIVRAHGGMISAQIDGAGSTVFNLRLDRELDRSRVTMAEIDITAESLVN